MGEGKERESEREKYREQRKVLVPPPSLPPSLSSLSLIERVCLFIHYFYRTALSDRDYRNSYLKINSA